ncbi:Laccase [uncultured archaeon]|nr:Laccase [uncultured archaeon]
MKNLKDNDVTSMVDAKKNDLIRMDRRTFVKMAGAAAAALALGKGLGFDLIPTASAFSQSPGLIKFGQPLRGVFPLDSNGIPMAIPDGTLGMGGALHYKIEIEQYTDQLHPDLGFTTLRGYKPQNTLGGAVSQRHLGGIIVANRGTPIQITFTNMLSGAHPIPIDQTIMGANLGPNRADTHLHGGFVPWISDGGPHAWFDPNGGYGASVILPKAPKNIFKVLNPKLKPGQAEYYYPNDQSARMVWYHDHTWGITRMNAYVGIASAYIIRDTFEGNLRNLGLPDYIENGGHEIPIVIQDKIFVGQNILETDPTWTGLTNPGSLWYAHTYDTTRWEQGPAALAPLPDPSVIPEFFGDTMLANGTVFPEATVEARRYRFRILNACQARFLNLQLYVDDGSPDGITLNPKTFTPTNNQGPDFLVLGTEGGFLPKPLLVSSNVTFNSKTLSGSLITAPAERWDLIVDFSGFAGQKIILYNDAPAPFPGGDPLNDYFPGAPNNPTQPVPGFGPNTRQIMRFKVVPATSKDSVLRITPGTDLTAGNDPLPVKLGNTTPPIPVTRTLTLNETFDAYGRLFQLLGTDVSVAQGFGRGYMDPTTETITLDPTTGKKDEVWQIVNLTGDTHPIHFHLVNVQIISRQPFNVNSYNGGAPTFTGPARPPDPNERGWKETVRMNPGEVTTVYIPFKLPTVPFTVPPSPRTGGNEYVWHCHILEHEEHDMMRPLVVT